MKNKRWKTLKANILSDYAKKSVSSEIRKTGLLVLVLFFMIGSPVKLFAQTGIIQGKITDHETGKGIAGVQLNLEGADLQTISDNEGDYELHNVPLGRNILLFNSSAHFNKKIEIEIASKRSNRHDVSLIRKTEESKKLNFSSTLTSKQINGFGDYSVKEALAPISGVMISREGDVNLRGVGFGAYDVTLDGQQLASTGLGSRSIDLGAISADMIRELEVIKVLTPDMNANALAGVINLHSFEPVSEGRTLNARFGGGANSSYINRTGANSRASLNYSEAFNDEFSVALNFSYQLDQEAREELGLEYGVEDFGNGPVDVVERVSPAMWVDGRGRFGSSVQLRYDPSENTNYYLRGMVNTDNRERVKHTDSRIANGDWADQFTTGEEGEMGSFTHDASQQNMDIQLYTVKAGGQHLFDFSNLSYSAGWSQGRISNRDYLFPFRIDELNYAVDWTDRDRPTMEITNRPTQVLEDGAVDRRFLIGQNFERIVEEHIDNKVSANIDVEIPFNFGSVKAGGNTLLTFKNGEYDENSFEYNRTLRLVSFNTLREPNRNLELFYNSYQIPWLVKTSDARAFLESQRPLFSEDQDLRRMRSGIHNYDASEFLYAGYGMATLEFDWVKIIGGARVEYTSSEYEGRNTSFNEDGEFIEAGVVVESKTDVQLFPNAQLILEPGDKNSIQLAYSRTIFRPDFDVLAPYEQINALDSTILRGNYQLDPVTSDNVDVLLERDISNTGMISLGLFYKQLTNFIVEEQQIVGGGEYSDYQEYSYQNGNEKATIYGVEVSLEQRLSFLPGFLSNLGIYANYTWSDSEFETDRNQTTAYPGQSPNVVNTALDYTKGRFSAQLSYHWTDELLSNLQEERGLAPSAGGQVYLDQYEDGANDLSANLQYQLSDRFRVWANVYNLLKSEQVKYSYNRQYYSTSMYREEGIEVSVGIRFDL